MKQYDPVGNTHNALIEGCKELDLKVGPIELIDSDIGGTNDPEFVVEEEEEEVDIVEDEDEDTDDVVTIEETKENV